ncbi:MAG TPA: hypothetical protein VG246_07490 [Acidimicrobiales bacterium]|nr:hypothetical protein [Acidimicrobiales bacterium]
MNVTGYAYPWDTLDDDAAASMAAELGLDAVALAANYHATRVVTPLHPTRRVLDVPHSAAFFPIRPDAWRDERLKPRAADWMPSNDAFNDAARRFEAVGVPVLAWIVATHEDDFGAANPEVVVRNAFGEPYPYALCPSNDDVRSYCGTLVEEALSTTSANGVVLEACGAVGLDHGSLHDKSDMAALTDAERWLLSLCFCRACHVELSNAGLNPLALAATVRDALSGPIASMESALGENLVQRLASFRTGVSGRLQRELTERVHAVRSDASVTIHASASPWATGSFPALGEPTDVAALTGVVANCWNQATADRELAQMKLRIGQKARLGAYIRADRVHGDPTETIERYRQLGMDELHLYHLGLFNRASLDVARELAAECHRAQDARATYNP